MPQSGDHITEIVVDGPTPDAGGDSQKPDSMEGPENMAAEIELNELFRGEQARGLQQMAGNFEHTGHLLRAVETKKFDEVDIGQAIAWKEAGKTGAHTDPRLPVAPVGS